MSKLEFFMRPLVAFDPSNAEHREHYKVFLDKNTWGHCPVRFAVPEATGGDLVKHIQEELLSYYVLQEFGVAKKPLKTQTKVAQKIEKMVDKLDLLAV